MLGLESTRFHNESVKSYHFEGNHRVVTVFIQRNVIGLYAEREANWVFALITDYISFSVFLVNLQGSVGRDRHWPKSLHMDFITIPVGGFIRDIIWCILLEECFCHPAFTEIACKHNSGFILRVWEANSGDLVAFLSLRVVVMPCRFTVSFILDRKVGGQIGLIFAWVTVLVLLTVREFSLLHALIWTNLGNLG